MKNATHYIFAVNSPKHGGGCVVITDEHGTIKRASSQFAIYCGMGFRDFLRGLRKDDPDATYEQFYGEWELVS